MALLTIRTAIQDALDRAVDQLVTIGVGILTIIVVLGIARLVKGLIRRAAWSRVDRATVDPSAVTLINNIIGAAVYFAAVTVLLALWGASWSTLLTAISISTLAVVLGLQDLLKSLLGGMFVLIDQPYQVGERISIGTTTGEVVDVRLRTTILRSEEGKKISLPNSVVLATPLANLDRPVASKSVVTLTDISGRANEVRNDIESALAQPPAIDSTVIVSEEIPRDLRQSLARLFRRGGPPAEERAGSVPLRVTILLPDSQLSGTVEENTVARCMALYPNARATVRGGASIP